jgi:predicted acetyltransferase
LAIEIRDLTEDRFREWLVAVESAFGSDVDDDSIGRFQRLLDPLRGFAAFDGDAIVGGAATFSFSLTVPGGSQLPTAGVTAVGVLPTHRRQGILRRLMARQLEEARERREPLAALWASEGTIYQRFGYGLASMNGPFDVERAHARYRLPVERSGRLRMVDADEAGRLMPPVHDVVARDVPGFYERNLTWWRDHVLADPERWRRGASKKFFVVHERDGAATGYAIYRIKEEWGDRGSRSELQVMEALALDPAAERDVWDYLFNVDLIHRISRHLGPIDNPLLLQLEQPDLLNLKVRDGLWLRILDVPAALAGRGYADDGEVTLEVADDFLPELAGRWRLRVADGAASVEPSDAPADLVLQTNDLAAVYLGAFTFMDLERAGRGLERTNGARRRADLMFASPIQPWCPRIF